MTKIAKILGGDWSRTMLVAGVLLVIALVTSDVSAISRGYKTTDSGLKTGMVVSLSDESTADEPHIERATQEGVRSILGITVNPGSSLVTVASAEGQVFVETDGEAQAYTADINGKVEKGDLLGLSPLKGVLMKVSSLTPVVAIALEDLELGQAKTYQVQSNDGQKEARVGLVTVNLDQQSINNLVLEKSDSSLERLGRTVVGRDVGEIRVAVALLIFLIVMIAEGGIIYGAVSSAISSIGRNPLAKKLIGKELLRVIVVVIAVLSFGAMSVYTILWV